MRAKRARIIHLIALLLFAPGSAFAQQDVPGSQDHPLVGRFAGSVIRIYDAKDFDEYTLPLGRQVFEDKRYKWTKSEKVEGKVTRITYAAPRDASTPAIVRSYEDALKQAGFEVLFRSREGDLRNYRRVYEDANPYPENKRLYLLGSRSPQYLASRLRRPEGDVYVTVYAAVGSPAARDLPTIQLDVIELKGLEAGLVAAGRMAEEIARSGRIAIYTLYFDTDKAEVKPESEPTLKEIAKLLQQSPGLKLYIVGHTDNAGALPYNVELSQRRAETVVRMLTSTYGVEAARVRSAGVGPLAPVSSNATEEGRARNRRVELVGQ